jgi:Fur family ferric uptake transcriptional regulator
MKNEEKKFSEYLNSKGLKFTPQRELILREIFSTHDHFEVDDLFVKLHHKNAHISRATVYRTLNLLVQGALLRQVISGERHSHYEHILGHRHHDHLVCLGCGKVIEFSNGRIEDLQDEVCKKYGFEARKHWLQIDGFCQDCRIKKESK